MTECVCCLEEEKQAPETHGKGSFQSREEPGDPGGALGGPCGHKTVRSGVGGDK